MTLTLQSRLVCITHLIFLLLDSVVAAGDFLHRLHVVGSSRDQDVVDVAGQALGNDEAVEKLLLLGGRILQLLELEDLIEALDVLGDLRVLVCVDETPARPHVFRQAVDVAETTSTHGPPTIVDGAVLGSVEHSIH